MSAEHVRDQLVSTTQDAAALVDVDGWAVDTGPLARSCEEEGKSKFIYAYTAPQQPEERDRAADVQAVSDLWESRGFSVSTSGNARTLTVYAKSDDVTSISFSTGPGLYVISGTTRCVDGDAEKLNEPTAP